MTHLSTQSTTAFAQWKIDQTALAAAANQAWMFETSITRNTSRRSARQIVGSLVATLGRRLTKHSPTVAYQS